MNLRRVAVIGGLALATAAAPAFIISSSSDVQAQCRSSFGSRTDGICLDGPDNPAPVLFPPVTVGPTDSGGPGISSGPLFPGQTIEMPVS